jgi:hypothetical protein
MIAETRRLRVSRPRMQADSVRVWAKGDRVAVTVVDLDAVRIFPSDRAAAGADTSQ